METAGAALLRDIPFADAITDWRRGVLDRYLVTVLRNQHRVVLERDDAALLQASHDGVVDGRARMRIHDRHDLGDRGIAGAAHVPSGQILGDRIAAVQVKNFTLQDAGGVLHGFGDDLLEGDADWDAVKAALAAIGYEGPVTAEMLPFCRLPDMVLPDMDLARDTAVKMKQIFGEG